MENFGYLQEGDWVICTVRNYNSISAELINFLNTNIGKYMENDHTNFRPYVIKYENVPQILNIGKFNGNMTRYVDKNEIIHFSPNKEDLQIYIDANKYNL